MSMVQLIECMQARMPWDVATKSFHDLELSPGRGWEGTKGKYLKEDSLKAEKYFQLLKDYKEHLICGEKSVKFYKLNPTKKKQIIEYYKSKDTSNDVLAKAYPFLIGKKELSITEHTTPRFIKLEEMEMGTAIIFSYVKSVQQRVALDRTTFPESTRKLLDEYTEILGVTIKKQQVFDVLWIPNDGDYADIRVDIAFNSFADIALASHGIIYKLINLEVGGSVLPPSENMFSLIKTLYDEKTEGTVVELAFWTSTSSTKHERMRAGKYQCLRDEAYHKAGTNGVKGNIAPFKLGIEYDVPETGDKPARAELYFNGQSHIILSNDPALDEIVIKKCCNQNDFEFIREKIVQFFLNQENEIAA